MEIINCIHERECSDSPMIFSFSFFKWFRYFAHLLKLQSLAGTFSAFAGDSLFCVYRLFSPIYASIPASRIVRQREKVKTFEISPIVIVKFLNRPSKKFYRLHSCFPM